MKLTSKSSEKISKSEMRKKIYEKFDSKGANAKLKDLAGNKKDVVKALKHSIEKREIFFYKGEFIPQGNLMDFYDEISKWIIDKVADLERTMPNGVDPVHLIDDKALEDLKYYPNEDKICLSWNALSTICTEMERRGDMEVEP